MSAETTEKLHIKDPDCAACAAKNKSGLKKVESVDSDFNLRKEITVLAAASILFGLQLVFEDWFHQKPSAGAEYIIAMVAYLLAGWNVLLGALRTIRKGAFFDENVLMVIATGGAMAIHAYSEAVGVMIFYKVGELLQELAVSRSRRSIRSLLAAKPDKALLKTVNGYREVSPESVGVGELILVKPGEKVPLDGEILSGNSQLDSSALTGEFVPVTAGPGNSVMAGQINKTGALTVRVSRPFSESSISKVDALAAIDTVVFDKTGTLTKGVFEVKEVVNQNGFSKAQLLEFAAAAEFQSNHPIASSILSAFSRDGRKLDTANISDHVNIAGKGVKARYAEHTIIVGNDNLLHLEAIDHNQCGFDGTVAHIAVDGNYAGYLAIGDEIRPDAERAIKGLRKHGVEHIAMLTGDNICAAEAVSKRLGLDRFYADLLPEDKVRIFEAIANKNQNKGKIAFVGDGINDAPVIARADVGVAMGALGSDAAIETADVVLMTDLPSKLVEAVSIAKQTRKIVWQNISLVFLIKAIFIALGTMGLASMWEAVFADMGTALVAVANSTRILGKSRASG